MTRNVVVINGGPRKSRNTAQLLLSCRDGALQSGANVEYFDLYDLDFKGCRSCYACKRKDDPVEVCSLKDELAPVLQTIHECDVLVIGSPIYWFEVTGETRSFLERLLYPCISYDADPGSDGDSRFGRRIDVRLFFTMGVSSEIADVAGITATLERYRNLLSELLGDTDYWVAHETLQFEDYAKYAASRFDEEQLKLRHKTVFAALICEAFELGQELGEQR